MSMNEPLTTESFILPQDLYTIMVVEYLNLVIGMAPLFQEQFVSVGKQVALLAGV